MVTLIPIPIEDKDQVVGMIGPAAEKLVRAGLAWAKSQNYELHASCWYVAKFIR